MSYLLFYIPITLVVFVVLETCKRDDPKDIAKRAVVNFGLLTLLLVLGSLMVFVVNKYL